MLGAWGCGVFRFPPAICAEIFYSLLVPPTAPFYSVFKHVVFAILDRNMVELFRRVCPFSPLSSPSSPLSLLLSPLSLPLSSLLSPLPSLPSPSRSPLSLPSLPSPPLPSPSRSPLSLSSPLLFFPFLNSY